MTAPPSGPITYRPATEADLADCERVWREGLDGYLGPMGFPPIQLENPGLRRLHAHTLATDPSRFWVATTADGIVVGFGSAVLRRPVWFLSMLFVVPGAQGRGIGRGLLDRILPSADARASTTLATATDSAQPISNALYASLGIVPRVPVFNLVGRPPTGYLPPALPAGVDAVLVGDDGSPTEAEAGAARDAIDREVLGFVHPEDHAFVRGDGRGAYLYRDPECRVVGYGYATAAGRVGPLAALDASLLGPILGHLLTAVEPRGASSVWLPGSGGEAMIAGLRAGLRIEGLPTLLCWSRPFVDLERYVPTSPGLL